MEQKIQKHNNEITPPKKKKRNVLVIIGLCLIIAAVVLILFSGFIQKWFAEYTSNSLTSLFTANLAERTEYVPVDESQLPTPQITDLAESTLADEGADDYYDDQGNPRESILSETWQALQSKTPPDAVLQIEKIELRIGVYLTKTTKEMYKFMRIGAAFYPSTAQPGTKGNVTMAAHRTGSSDFFRKLNELSEGDEILLHTAYVSYKYLVEKVFVVKPTDLYVIKQSNESLITLTTCERANGSSHGARLIVRAKLTSVAVGGDAAVPTPTASVPAS